MCEKNRTRESYQFDFSIYFLLYQFVVVKCNSKADHNKDLFIPNILTRNLFEL